MDSKEIKKNRKITTIKISSETKERLDHLKEFERESYDEIIRKMLFILNTIRSNPESAQGILKGIDLKLKRNQQVYSNIPLEKSGKSQEKTQEKNSSEERERRTQNQNRRSKFLINRKPIRK
ncbi:MAG: hypothetical protein KKB21_01820 [Nanoarchaeota archaeon]|nr:hypothetical protein [Nanoarchaeota archaeon]MBU4086295.1 hypothetical protein [Nanoarchaeota archaeon]